MINFTPFFERLSTIFIQLELSKSVIHFYSLMILCRKKSKVRECKSVSTTSLSLQKYFTARNFEIAGNVRQDKDKMVKIDLDTFD